MSYIMDCACGAEVKLYDKADRNICRACDVANRFVVLRLVVLVRPFDSLLADLLVRMTGYETDDVDRSRKDTRQNRMTGVT